MSLSPAARNKNTAVKLHAFPQNVKAAIATALYEGARKYGAHNWREHEIIASDYYNATVGHLDNWWEGEDIDRDSKLNHLIKVGASIVVMIDALLNDKLIDDRPIKNKNSNWKLDLKAHTKELIDLYPNCCEPFVQERKVTNFNDHSPEQAVYETRPNQPCPEPLPDNHARPRSKQERTPPKFDLCPWMPALPVQTYNADTPQEDSDQCPASAPLPLGFERSLSPRASK